MITAVVSRHIKYGRKHSTQYTQGISSGILCLKRLFLERYCAVGTQQRTVFFIRFQKQ